MCPFRKPKAVYNKSNDQFAKSSEPFGVKKVVTVRLIQ